MNKKKIDYSELGKERIVTVGELFREIGRRIWIVIVLAAIFAIILGAYKYHRDVQSAEEKAASSTTTVIADTSLSEDEINAVKNVMYVRDNIDDLQTYMDNSVLMQIDANDESRVVLQYRIELPDDEESMSYASDLMASYQSYVSNRALAADLKEGGYGLDVQYLGELISFSVDTASSSDSEEETISTSFTMRITHRNQTSAENLANLIEDLMAEYSNAISKSIGEHNLTLINRAYMSVVNTDRRTFKSDRVGNILTMQSRLEEMEADLTNAQKDLLKQYEEMGVSDDDLLLAGADQDEVVEEIDAEQAIASARASVHISRRYVLIGLLVGIVIAFIYICAAYIMRGSINSANDIRYLYNLRVLGEVKLSGNKKIRKGRIDMTEEQQIEVLVANLKSICKENGITKILINGSEKLTMDQELAEKIGEEMKQFDVETEYATNLPYSADAIGQLDKYKTVVLLEKIRYSDYRTIEAEIRTCMEHDAEVVGAVVFS